MAVAALERFWRSFDIDVACNFPLIAFVNAIQSFAMRVTGRDFEEV